MSQHRLHPQGPYDGVRLLAFLGAHAVPGVESWDGTTYARSMQTPAGAVVAAMTAANGGVGVRLTGSADVEVVVLQRLAHLLALTYDTTAAERHLVGDPLVGPSVVARPGLRSPGSIEDGETLVRTVIGQQVSLAGARAVLGRVAADLGVQLPAHLQVAGVRTLFPTMAALAVVDPLRLPVPRARARAVVACAAAVAACGGLPQRAHLLTLSGVGAWTADYVDLRCRRDPDVFLASDLAVRRVLERAGLDGSPKAAAAMAAAWAPYRSIALIHLWTDYLES